MERRCGCSYKQLITHRLSYYYYLITDLLVIVIIGSNHSGVHDCFPPGVGRDVIDSRGVKGPHVLTSSGYADL